MISVWKWKRSEFTTRCPFTRPSLSPPAYPHQERSSAHRQDRQQVQQLLLMKIIWRDRNVGKSFFLNLLNESVNVVKRLVEARLYNSYFFTAVAHARTRTLSSPVPSSGSAGGGGPSPHGPAGPPGSSRPLSPGLNYGEGALSSHQGYLCAPAI